MITASFEALLRAARRALAEGRAEEARHQYDKARGLRPDSPDAHYGLALAEFLLNDVQSAAFHFKEVTRLDPLRAGAYVNLGAALTRLGEHRDAVAAIRRGIQLEPRRAEAHYNLGLVYRAAGDNVRAIQAFQEAARIDPNLADAHLNLGNALLDEGAFLNAVQTYRRALELQPGWERAAHGLAQAEEALESATAKVTAMASQASTAVAPERRIDAERHQAVLETMHEEIKSAQTAGISFLQALSTEVAPAVKDLATSLIGREPSRADLHRKIERFENAVAHFQKAQETMQTHARRAGTCGDRLTTEPRG